MSVQEGVNALTSCRRASWLRAGGLLLTLVTASLATSAVAAAQRVTGAAAEVMEVPMDLQVPLILKVLERPGMLEPGTDLLREAFDMLEEDFEEERFFVTVRRAYWQAPEGSQARNVAEALIRGLDF